MAKQQSASVATLKAIAEAFNAHDLDAIMEFFAEDCSLDMPRGAEPWGARFTGKAAVREGHGRLGAQEPHRLRSRHAPIVPMVHSGSLDLQRGAGRKLG